MLECPFTSRFADEFGPSRFCTEGVIDESIYETENTTEKSPDGIFCLLPVFSVGLQAELGAIRDALQTDFNKAY